MVFDPERDSPWVFFGTCSGNQAMPDYMHLNSQQTDWVKFIPPVDGPRRRAAHVSAHDIERGIVYLYGGYIPGLLISEDELSDFTSVWSLRLDNNTWQQLSSGDARPMHRWAVGVYDPVSDLFLVYGGDLSSSGVGESTISNELEGFDPESRSWSTIISEDKGLPPRRSASGVYCPCSGSVFVFGGEDQFGIASELPPSEEQAFWVPVETKAIFRWVSRKESPKLRSGNLWAILGVHGSERLNTTLDPKSLRIFDCRSGQVVAAPSWVSKLGSRRWLLRFEESVALHAGQKENEGFWRITGKTSDSIANFMAPVPSRRDTRYDHVNLEPGIADLDSIESLAYSSSLDVIPVGGNWEIRWQGFAGEPSQIEILDAKGRILVKMATRIDGATTNTESYSWNGSDSYGRRVPRGVYFVRVRTGPRQEMGKIIVR